MTDTEQNQSGDLWAKGEPTEDGYYLVRVGQNPLQEGSNSWVFLAKVFVDTEGLISRPGMVYYLDHHSGSPGATRHSWGGGNHSGKFRGEVVAYCAPAGENFEAALREVEEFYTRLHQRLASHRTYQRFFGSDSEEEKAAEIEYLTNGSEEDQQMVALADALASEAT